MSLRKIGIIALLTASFGFMAADLSATSEQNGISVAVSELPELGFQLANNSDEFYLCNVKGNWRYREDPMAYNNGGCFLMGKHRLIEKTTTSKSFLLS